MGHYNKKAFTLVELLVVIAIMATIMAVLLPNLMGARERAKDAARIQDISSMKDALRLYYNDNQAYPVGSGGALGTGFSGYMPNASNIGYTYNYYQTDNGDGFIICVNLESGLGDEDTNSQSKCGLTRANFTVAPATVCGLEIGVTGDKVFTVCAK